MDWIKIKNEYINTDTSYRKLAEKHGVSVTAIANKAKAEKWVEHKKKHLNRMCTKVVQETAEKIVSSEVSRIDKILSISDKLISAIDKAVDELDVLMIDGVPIKTGVVIPSKLRQVVQSLKDIKEITTDDTTEADKDTKIVVQIAPAEGNTNEN